MDIKIINFEYKFRKPKPLENDVFVIYTPKNITFKPGEKIDVDTGIKIYLPKFIEGRMYLLFSHRNNGMKLLNSSCISQKYNCNIELEEIYRTGIKMPPWKLILSLQNGSFAEPLTIKKGSPIGFLNFYNTGEEIKYKFKKERF